MKTIISNTEIGNKCTISYFNDGSCWSAQVTYGVSGNVGIIVANYVNGKMQYDIIRNKNGDASVKNKVLIKEFKVYVEEKFKEMSQDWLTLHKELYKI